MRPLEFKAWAKESKKWIRDKDLLYPDKLTIKTTKEGFRFLNEKESAFIFCQFTGLLDKNGKKIWEGDIVKYWRSREEHVSQVVWSPDEWKNIPDAGFWPLIEFQGQRATDIEVIGNIHENPDLLEAK